MGFDPMTGEPIGRQQAPEQEVMGFDPMTGEPIGRQQAPEQEAGGFDPMTGKPIGRQQAPEQETGGFDPMTGKPIGKQLTQEEAPVPEAGGFDPMTGKPIQNKDKKKSKLPVVIGGIAALILIVVAAVVVFSSGLILGKSGKVMMATANTVKDTPHFVKALKPLSLLNNDKYTVAFSCDVSNVDVSGELRNGGSEKQVSMKLSSNGEKLDLLAGVDSKTAKLQVPALSNYVFVYNYKGKNTGYLLDEVDDDDLEAINTMLEYVGKKTNTKDIYSELFKIFKDELKSIKFVNAEKEEYTVNDKDVNCKGYTAVITSSNMIHIVDKVEKLFNDQYADLLDLDEFELDDFAKEFDDLRDEMEDIDDIELTFYIYKNKLAAIVLENPDTDVKIELCFEGGDYRMQNMVLKMDNYRLRVTGSDNGTKEAFTIETRINGGNKKEIGSLEYNYENGKFSINLSGMTAEGKLTSSKSELNLKISDFKESYYSVSPDLNITIKKGAKMDKYSGKEFDLGNASKDDCMDLAEDIQDKIYDGDFNSMMRLFGIGGSYSYWD